MLETRSEMNRLAGQAEILHRMDEATRKKLQHELVGMYMDIQSVCRQHQLTVMLAGGSALGAARHSGFIPWDDDLDLMMPSTTVQRNYPIGSVDLNRNHSSDVLV